MQKRALLTGITGMDGSLLAEKLLQDNYVVHGVIRRSSIFNTARIDHLRDNENLKLHYGDLCDGSSLRRLLLEAQPDQVFHLGAQSQVRVSFDMPEYTTDVTAVGTLRLLEAIRELDLNPKIYIAGSSEMFGSSPAPQNELTPFRPRSSYAASKAYGFHIAQQYRDAYGLFITNGILFNHTHTRQSETFVTRKITRAAARIRCGLQDKLALGNLEAKRDMGWAPDYVDAMRLMMNRETPDDFVIGTGKSTTIQKILEFAFASLKLDYKEHVVIDPRFFRATEVDHLEADATKAITELNWKPTVSLYGIIDMMVRHDYLLAQKESGKAPHEYYQDYR